MPKEFIQKQCRICGDDVKANDLCAKHYLRELRYGDAEFTKRPIDWGTKTEVMVRRIDIKEHLYKTLFDKQNGVCAICGLPEHHKQHGVTRRLSIDHCHITGAIRGLLCSDCNTAIGSMQDNPDRLKSAINYLTNHDKESNTNTIEHQFIQEKKLCSVEGCDRIHASQGFCSKHYKQFLSGKDPHDVKHCKQCGNSLVNMASLTADFCNNSCKMKYHRSQGCYAVKVPPVSTICLIEGCKEEGRNKGLCRSHYMEKFHKEMSDEQKQEISRKITEKQTGVSKPHILTEEGRAKIKAAAEAGHYSHWQGKTHTEESKAKMSKSIKELSQGIAFTSLTNALQYYGMLMPTLTRALKTGKPILKGDKMGLQFEYIEHEAVANESIVNPNLSGKLFIVTPVDYTKCSIEGCDKPYAANGFCMNHYKKNRKLIA